MFYFFEAVFTSCVNMIVTLIVFYSFCSYMGWVRRIVWWWVESELSKLFNGATVTLGSLNLNLLQGRAVVNNAVIHTPHQEAWKWDSPLIARVGRIELEWNMFDIIYQVLYVGTDNNPPIVDLYTIIMSDAQIFVERKQNIFNVYLLDGSLKLPNPADILKAEKKQYNDSLFNNNKGLFQSPSPDGTNDTSDNNNKQQLRSGVKKGKRDIAGGKNDEDSTISLSTEDEAEQQAQELVTQLFKAVKQIGNRGGWNSAWKQHKETFTQKLRELQGSTKITESLQESVRVIRKVGRTVAKSSHNTTTILTPPPQRELAEGEIPPPELFCRVGRVVLRQIRVFTRQRKQWNKPIVLKEIIVRSSELCPPMSSLDDRGYPEIYQPIDKLVEVVWKRILTESAKSQTGQLLNTAVGEVLGFAMTKIEAPKSSNASISNNTCPSFAPYAA